MFTTADNYVVHIHRQLPEPLRSMVVASALMRRHRPQAGQPRPGLAPGWPGRRRAPSTKPPRPPDVPPPSARSRTSIAGRPRNATIEDAASMAGTRRRTFGRPPRPWRNRAARPGMRRRPRPPTRFVTGETPMPREASDRSADQGRAGGAARSVAGRASDARSGSGQFTSTPPATVRAVPVTLSALAR